MTIKPEEWNNSQVKLSSKQVEALGYLQDKTTTEVLFGGGAGGAKSRLGCYWLMKSCIKYPETRWLMGRAVKKVLKETTLKTFQETIKSYQVDAYVKIRENSDVIKFKNDSEIVLHDLFYYPADPYFDRLGSLEITGGFIDETQQVVKKAKDIVKSRIRYKLDEYDLIPKLLMACNPAKNWLYSDYYMLDREGKLPKEKKFVKALAKDNPFISRHYIDLLKQLDTASRERLLEGNWEYDDDPTSMLSFDQICDMFTNSHIPIGQEKYLTVDVALEGSDKFVIMVWAGWVVVDHLVIAKSDGKVNVDKIRELKSKHRISNRNMVYDADGAGGYLGGYFPGAIAFKANGRAVENKEVPRGYENIKAQCAYIFAANADNVWFLSIAKNETDKKETTEELEQLKKMDVDKDGPLKIIKKDVMKERLGRSPDFLDNCIMRGIFELPRQEGLRQLNG